MPRELITLQIGQCGNQLGCRFWELALAEHSQHNAAGVFDDALSSFFRNVDARVLPPQPLAVGERISTLKARAVLVDMEEGVVNEALHGPLGELFDQTQLLTDVSGSGNNWAHGYSVYGSQYRQQLLESVRTAVEACDSPQSFFLMHSLGGGTGSGLGSYLLEALSDAYPEIYRFTCSVFPSRDDDVVTSPYNSMLALAKLVEHADCVLPLENEALHAIAKQISPARARRDVTTALGDVPGSARRRGSGSSSSSAAGKASGITGSGDDEGRPYGMMNGIAASLLLNLTSSMRFPGTLNVDLNEITMNLVPFPRLHFLLGSVAPLYSLADVRLAPRRVNEMFSQVLQPGHQMITCDPRRDRYLAMAWMARGAVNVGDVRRNVARLRPSLDFIHWNPDGFKVGLCDVPPAGHPCSLLALSNNCCITGAFGRICDSFDRLYRRKAYMHHYTQYIDQDVLAGASSAVAALYQEYTALRAVQPSAGVSVADSAATDPRLAPDVY